MKKSNELLIGLFTCILLAILYWGINFLKGENIFSNKRFFYSVFENVDGLTISRPVTMNGFRVGQVSNIAFNSTYNGNLIVQVSIEEDIMLWDIAAGLALIIGAGGRFNLASGRHKWSYKVYASNKSILKKDA